MTQAVEVYSFNILAGQSIQLWIHGYDQRTFVGFDLKPEIVGTGVDKGGHGVFQGESLFLSYNLQGVGEHVDETVGYSLLFTNKSQGVDVQEVSGFLINLYEPVTNFPP